jgi:Na+-translocating ferredoxin:NAD+ oxidoreductase RnfE subunit
MYIQIKYVQLNVNAFSTDLDLLYTKLCIFKPLLIKICFVSIMHLGTYIHRLAGIQSKVGLKRPLPI